MGVATELVVEALHLVFNAKLDSMKITTALDAQTDGFVKLPVVHEEINAPREDLRMGFGKVPRQRGAGRVAGPGHVRYQLRGCFVCEVVHAT